MGRNINGIDLQSSLSCIRDAGRNHTISAHCTTPMSFRSIEIDPCTKGLVWTFPHWQSTLSGIKFSPQFLLNARHCHPTPNAFYIAQHTNPNNFSIHCVQPQCIYAFHSQAAVILLWNGYGSAKCVCLFVQTVTLWRYTQELTQ